MKIGNESILFFSRVSLSIFSLNILSGSSLHFVDIRGIYTRVEWNVKSQVFQNKAGSDLSLAI